ncbi:EF-P beta-lysylation protein EpmB [Glaciecola sp. 1036]|uniref:EF-P beta-lysylation protein EpmB n=1 Tax=Alteromonadaceae TaxID=72275 RepID=UPI003D04A157
MQIIQKNFIEVESDWQKELANSFTRPDTLLEYLGLDPNKYRSHFDARQLFPMRVPRYFASLMESGNWHDPLLQQVMPHSNEYLDFEGFLPDPLQEQKTTSPGILHKYQSRVLLIVKGGCAINCRYCFRRHFPYQQNAMSKGDWISVFSSIQQDKNINEVILSGGDPLMAKDSHLSWMCQQIEQIPHIKRLRIHTRLPVVLPQRINAEFLAWLTQSRLQKVMVLHINHGNEISPLLAEKVAKLNASKVTVLNQAVLLKGINDTLDSQVNLHEASFSAGIIPYYLHLLDKVKGAGHFDVSHEKAVTLAQELLTKLPGFLVPKLVREIPGESSKTPVDLYANQS